jgi:hypothetical protein
MTAAEAQRQGDAASRAHEMALARMGYVSGSALSAGEYADNMATIGNAIGDPSYNGMRELTAAERAAVAKNPAAQRAQDTIYMNTLGNANSSLVDRARATPLAERVGLGISSSKPSSTGSFGGSLVTGRPSAASQDVFAQAKAGSKGGSSSTKKKSSSKIGTDAGDGMVWAKSSTSNALVRKRAPKASTSSSPSKSSSSGGGGGGGGGDSSKILCCAYYNLGYLPRDIWRLDQRYGVWLHRNDPALMEGYHAWAAPLADYVQQDTAGAKIARAVMWPIVSAWAAEMAHTMKPEKYKANYAGKAIKFVGEAFSRMCGKLMPRKAQGVA